VKVFLLSTNTDCEPYPVYPLGMAVVASALTAAGHEVRQFDYLAMGASANLLCKTVQDFQPHVFGVSLRNIDNVDSCSALDRWYLERAKKIIDVLRSVLDAPVIVGGPAFSIMPEAILDYLSADYGVKGEGEQAVLDLLERINRDGNGPRIICGKPLQPSQMHSPLIDKDILAFYSKESGLPGLQTKRGCPHKCIYCSYPLIEGSCLRVREPENVIDDMARMSRDHGVEHVFFTDSVFNDEQGNYLVLAEALARRGLPMRWSAFFRPAAISSGELDLLLRSGLMGMEVGSDALTEATLNGLGKGFGLSDVIHFNATCVAKNIPVAHYIIIGGPSETTATIHECLENMEKLQHCVVFIYSGLRILPGTRLLAQAIAEGILTESTSLLQPVYYHSPLVEREAMHATVRAALNGKRDRFFPPQNGQDRMNVMHRFGYRGLIWDRLIASEKQKARNQAEKKAINRHSPPQVAENY
jgi:lipid biosynthesis B12-binding/radical SAM protein